MVAFGLRAAVSLKLTSVKRRTRQTEERVCHVQDGDTPVTLGDDEMDDPGGGGGGNGGFDVGDDVVAVVIRDETGQHNGDGQVFLEEETVSATDGAASGSNVIVDDSPLQNQMERNKECESLF